MSKRGSKADGAEFFKPKAAGSKTRADDAPLGGPEEGFTKGEKAIMATLTMMQEKLGTMEAALGAVKARLDSMDGRLKGTETAVQGMRLDVVCLNRKVAELEGANKDWSVFKENATGAFVVLEDQVERLENARRGPNIRVVGFPPLEVGLDLTEVVRALLADQANPHTDGSPFRIVKAYRIPSRRSGGQNKQEQAGEGTVIVVLQEPGDREGVLKKAALKKEIFYKGRRILLFPDLGPATAARRKGLMEVRKAFLQFGAQATIQFPARLRVQLDGKTHVFAQIEAAKNYLAGLQSKSGDE